MNFIISFVYYIGISSCAMQGAEKGKNDHYPPFHRYILNSFGGGLIRDYVLAVHPWLFTRDALPDLTLVILVGCIYSFYFSKGSHKNHKKYIDIIVILTDALGLGSFIAIGMNKALTCTNNMIDIIICGYITAVGGGFLASEKSLVQTLQDTKIIMYHILTILCCLFYYLTKFENGLVIITTILILLSNTTFFDVYHHLVFSIIRYKPYIKPFIQREYNFYCNLQARNYYIKKNHNKKWAFPILKKRYLVFSKIRQC